jgi:hypothetical protein
MVLYWLKNETAFYNSYLASQKELILSGSTPDHWRHVPRRLNPANDGTKGAKKFNGAHRWFKWPPFLREDSRLCPDNTNSNPVAEELEEIHVMRKGSGSAEGNFPWVPPPKTF